MATRETGSPVRPIFRIPRPSSASAGDWAQLVRFLVVGASGYIVNLVVFSLLVHFVGTHYLVAAIGAFAVAWSNNFFLNKFWTFRQHGFSVVKQGIRYLAVSLVALGLNLVLLFILVQIGLSEVPAQAIAIVAVTPVNFLMNRRWSFL